MSDTKIKELFGRYGDVLDLDPHTTDSSVVYVVSDPPHCILNSLSHSLSLSPSFSWQTMDVKGAEEVVANLNGYQTSPGHRLVVEKYVSHPMPIAALNLARGHHRFCVT